MVVAQVAVFGFADAALHFLWKFETKMLLPNAFTDKCETVFFGSDNVDNGEVDDQCGFINTRKI